MSCGAERRREMQTWSRRVRKSAGDRAQQESACLGCVRTCIQSQQERNPEEKEMETEKDRGDKASETVTEERDK